VIKGQVMLTDAQKEFESVVKSFVAAGRENHGNYAYVTGYLESIAIQMFENLNHRQQQALCQRFRTETVQQKKEAAG
jgi:hypothetical protein